ncbi:MAG: hypothetical protein OXU34_04305 [Gammaproteobacteria bacterium]|nr:hypothetical protein [Gammaproteobacteria bacterium]
MKTKTTQLPMTKEIASVMWAGKCLKDKAWARQVQSDPAKILGREFPGEQIRTVQNTADTLHICVPHYEATLDEVLGDEALDGVAGGFSFVPGREDIVRTMNYYQGQLDDFRAAHPTGEQVSRSAALSFNRRQIFVWDVMQGLAAGEE